MNFPHFKPSGNQKLTKTALESLGEIRRKLIQDADEYIEWIGGGPGIGCGLPFDKQRTYPPKRGEYRRRIAAIDAAYQVLHDLHYGQRSNEPKTPYHNPQTDGFTRGMIY